MTELEIMQRAKMYLDKLAQGIDPISGQEIPNDSVLNNVRLARWLFLCFRDIGSGHCQRRQESSWARLSGRCRGRLSLFRRCTTGQTHSGLFWTI